jgi:hypothetical protein
VIFAGPIQAIAHQPILHQLHNAYVGRSGPPKKYICYIDIKRYSTKEANEETDKYIINSRFKLIIGMQKQSEE